MTVECCYALWCVRDVCTVPYRYVYIYITSSLSLSLVFFAYFGASKLFSQFNFKNANASSSTPRLLFGNLAHSLLTAMRAFFFKSSNSFFSFRCCNFTSLRCLRRRSFSAFNARSVSLVSFAEDAAEADEEEEDGGVEVDLSEDKLCVDDDDRLLGA